MDDIIFSAYTTAKEPNHAFDKTLTSGDLIHSGGKYYIHPRVNTVNVDGEIGRHIIMHEVIPETITYVVVKGNKDAG